MDDNTIEVLLDKLEEANSDDKKLEIKAEIENKKEITDGAIRKHQREVSYDTKEFTVEMVVDKYGEGKEDDTSELFVPDYQRDFVWGKSNQSRLIESLMIGLPVPYIFIADVNSDDPEIDGRIEIVDGSQRIRTLHSFLINELVLCDLKLVNELNGFRFCDLPASRQRRFKRISIRIIELSGCTEDTRRDLFERINTGSDDLKDMEVRKGSKFGSSPFFQKVIAVCADREKFSRMAPMSPTKASRGEKMEFVLRFFAYYSDYLIFEHSVVKFLDQYLDKNSMIDQSSIDEKLNLFDSVMSFVDKKFPHGFAKSKTAKSTPRVRFEALSVGVALAITKKPGLDPRDINEWLVSTDFKSLTTGDGSNSKTRVKERIEYVRDKLLGEG
jgi:uncharacterized protein with ParB-like and HNH nuclease domain